MNDERANEQMAERTDGRTDDGCMDEGKDGWRKEGIMNECMCDAVTHPTSA